MRKIKVMSIFGTRPEAIKMAPLVKELEKREEIKSIVCVTAQHREMLDQVLKTFGITPDFDLDIMKQGQTLGQITTRALNGLEEIVKDVKPDIVLAVDALAARSPKRLNTTIQLTDTGISPGAGVGNNRKELNEESLGCPVIAIGVPTVLDAVTIAKEEAAEDVKAFFVMPRTIDSAVQYVSELIAGGINRVNQKEKCKN